MMPVGILAHGRRRPRPGARPRARAVALDWGIFSQHFRGEFTQQLQRSAVRARGHFPTDEAALKLLYLVLNRTEKEWTMPPREWAMAKAQFAVLFGQRFTRAMA